MPILSNIGRRSIRVRLLQALMALLLLAGSAAMIYPFLIMVSGSMKSTVDVNDFDLVPAFLLQDDELYCKHMEGLFNERLSDLQICYDEDTPSFEAARPPEAMSPELVAEWDSFLQSNTFSPFAQAMGYIQANVTRTIPHNLRAFKRQLMQQYDNELERMNAEQGTEFVNWNAFVLRPEDYLARKAKTALTPWQETFMAFKQTRPARGDRYYFSVSGFYKSMFLKSQYTRDIQNYNTAHETTYASYAEVLLSPRLPRGGALEQEDWEYFVRNTLNLQWVRVAPEAAPDYREFLKDKYRDVSTLNHAHATAHASFEDIPLPAEPPPGGVALSDWDTFIRGWTDPDSGRVHQPSAGMLLIDSTEFRFQDYLRQRHGDIATLNRTLGTDFRSFEQILPPQKAWHYAQFLAHRGELRREFAARNFLTVIDYLVLHGRGVLNTVIYCLLAVLTALIVNPLAAYAMSRYRMPSTYKLLLFMLLTMAFPPMVTQIPVFLLLRDLNLLNTFAALVLPAMANGYSIFLLKGFFDSLPRELYESASIDGASEWTMFWSITMNLSRPILAVVALGAFNTAYASFMFALLICQDERMWTLMVWLYQLQSRSGQAVVYASLLIAALPTFLVFFFCQRIIMRGIVVPVEK